MAETKVEFNLLTFYKTVVRKRKPYCAMCFRTDEKLTHPVNAKNLLVALDKSSILEKRPLVCVWCEASCRRALALLHLIDAATAVHGEMARLQHFKEPRPSRTPQLQRVIEKYWQSANLTHTSILLVDSEGVQRIEQKTKPMERSERSERWAARTVPPRPPPAEPPADPLLVPLPQLLKVKNLSRDVRIASLLPDRKQMIVRDGSKPDNFTLHPTVAMGDGTLIVPTLNLVISQDSDSVRANPPGVVSSGSNNGQMNQNLPFIVTNTARNDTSLPIIQQTSLPIIQQTSLPIIQQINSVNSVNQMSEVNKVLEFNQECLSNSVFFINNTGNNSNNSGCGFVLNSNNMSTVLPQGVTNTQINISDNSSMKRNIQQNNSASKKQCTSEVIDLIQIEDVIGKGGQECDFKVQSGTSENSILTTLLNKEGPILPTLLNKEGPSKQAVLKSGKIDWEDKIPMDVISFMDATDPHAEELMSAGAGDARPRVPAPAPAPPPLSPPPLEVCPFGVISEVRSEQSNKQLDLFLQDPPLDAGVIKIELVREENDDDEKVIVVRNEENYENDEETDRNSPELIVSDIVPVKSKRKRAKMKNESLCDTIIDLCSVEC